MNTKNKSEATKPGTPGSRLSLLIVAGAALAFTLPFIFKAFHLDDTVFVWLGQEKLHDFAALGLPDHGYEGNFFSLYLDTHPPLWASYLALLIWIFGGASEAGLHLGFLFFPVLAALSMFFLARRFTDSPLAAALLLVVTPGFMVMSQSVMTDVPSLSFWLAAIAAYVFGVDRDDGRLLAMAAVALSLAIFTTYQSVSLLPLLLLYALLERRVTLRTIAPLAAGLLVFAAIIGYYLVRTGGPPKLSYSIGVNLTTTFIANKILATLSVIGGATVFPLFIVVGMLKGRKEYLYFGALVAAMLIFFVTRVVSGEYTFVAAILQVVFYTAGILALYRFFNDGAEAAFSRPWSGKDREDIFLILWISGVLVYNIVLLPYASTRYLLPLFPPVVLMFVRYARTVFPEKERWTRFAWPALACTAVMGLAVSIADYQLAGVYRSFASTYADQLQADSHQLWFAGEFGLRYYLQEQGGTYLTREDNSPASGDKVVLSHGLIAYFISNELRQRLQYDRTIEYPSAWPLRVEDPGSQAGFYDQFHGNLPWSLSTSPMESIDIYTVR